MTGLVPPIGPERGGLETVITGTNFVPGDTLVAFGGLEPADCVSSTECQVVSPPGTGTVSVLVGANGQWSLDTPADDYTFLGAPTITSISPTAGPPGTVITLEGTNFYTTPITRIRFGPEPVAVTCSSFTRCTVPSPPGVGTVDVVVVTPSSTSNSVQFTMQPSVTQISPTGGPAAGNTAVTITGTGFDTAPGVTTVQFGGAAALAVGCANATTCTAVSPPGSGTVSVRVTVSRIQSPAPQRTTSRTSRRRMDWLVDPTSVIRRS